MWEHRRPNAVILECLNCRWEGGEVGKVGKVRGWCGWEGGRVVVLEGGRFIVLFKGRGCRVIPKFHLFVFDVNQENQQTE